MLDSAQGPDLWRSLDELSGNPEFQKFVEDEFPDRVPDWNDASKRRTFLKLMGASLALAGVSACTKQPPEMIVPYVRDPERIVPGKPLFYATARPASGGALGLLAESHMGRPTKVEGNPSHPASLGATDIHAQASILDLWDPDRAQSVTRNGQVSSWLNFIGVLVGAREEHAARQGAGLYILTQPFTSPTLGWQMQEVLRTLPQARWHQWEPVLRTPGTGAVYNFANADVVVSLDADFLGCGAGSVRYSGDFARRRKFVAGQAAGAASEAGEQQQARMNRLYVAEGTPSVTGGMADHRVRVRTSEVPAFAAELARAVGAGGGPGGGALPEKARAMAAVIARDLQAHPGRCVVVAGDYQPPAVHALARQMNQTLGNVGSTVTYSGPVDVNPVDNIASLRELVEEINAGRVQTLVILGGNPVYDAPADLQFAEALRKVRLRAHLSMYFNETSGLCQWHVPEAHYLESWSDARAYDGTVTIIQPLIAPLYNGVTAHQVLSVLLNEPDASPNRIVKDYWATQARGADFNVWWQQALHDGVVGGTGPVAAAGPLAAAGAGAARVERRVCPNPCRRARWRLCFVRIRRCGMGLSPITHGSRRCPSRRTR
jgi:MoCo/4Fe-4S cofactor protein with predicted Tat translocation signal